MQPSECRSCSAKIIWAKTVHGRSMPLDSEPREDGNIAILDGIAHVVDRDDQESSVAGPLRYVSHFVTCKNAAAHRKEK